MLGRTSAALVVLSSLFVVGTSRGDLTGISTAPGPIMLGLRDFTGEDNGTWPIASYKWEIKCLMPNAINGNYFNVGEGSGLKTRMIQLSHYDEHRIRCTATYAPLFVPPFTILPPPPPTSKELDITVVRPNKTVITEGLSPVKATRLQKIRLSFQIQYNDTGYTMPLGWPQEYIWRTFPVVEQIGWIPATQAGLDASKYTREGPWIRDFKEAQLADADWNPIGLEEAFLKYEQQNRLVITKCDGAADHINLTKHKLLYRKKSNTEWTIEEEVEEEEED